MTLQAGTKLGTYEVVALLGAGGMGEVYRARDTKLGRDAAIKVLPESFANNAERLARFEREAHLLASLNHPGIATIYGLEEADGVRFLAMELVEGETLAERIAHGAVSWDDALAWFEQMADALHAAHEKGIVHRDLKPANVMLTPEGRVKILDFGLAKALQPAVDEGAASQSPTLTKDTALGAIVGTAAYMSPEQARGKQVDKRTDVWAFGCVVYEVLTGKKAFVGETVSDTIAAILEREPDWDRLPPSAPEKARRLLRRCLSKDPARRLHDVADARIELSDTAVERDVAVETRSSGHAWPVSGAVALATALVVTVFWNLTDERMSPRPLVHFVLDGPPLHLPQNYNLNALDISRDGTKLVYVGRASDNEMLFLRRLNEAETVSIPGTDGAAGPFFSPDGEHVGFFVGTNLKVVALQGGAVRTLGGSPNPRGGDWAGDDTIVYAPAPDEGLLRVAASGGKSEPGSSVRIEDGERSHRWPAVLPGGSAIVFTIADNAITTFDDSAIAVQTLDGGRHRVLIQGGSYPRYVPTGHLLYGRGGELLAVPFDPSTLEISGHAGTVVEGVVTQPVDGAVQFAVSDSGTLAYAAGEPMAPRAKLVWVDRAGAASPLPSASGPFFGLSLSPSGDVAALGIDGANANAWLYDIVRGTLNRFTLEWNNGNGVWSPDGARLTFGSGRAGGFNLFEQATDRTTDVQRVTESMYHHHPMSYAPDGQLAYVELHPDTQADIWILPDGGSPFPLLRTSFDERYPRFSPDGAWLAFASDETGQFEVYVQGYPGPASKLRVSTNGGTMPVWSRDGKELFYRGEGWFMAVPVSHEPAFALGTPRKLFEDHYYMSQPYFPAFNYDVAPDGERFLMIEPEPPSEPENIHIVLNWFQELERLVPTGR